MSERLRIAVGVSGASGAPIAVRLLELLGTLQVERHLIVSRTAAAILRHETGLDPDALPCEARHDNADMFAPVASGSFRLSAMAIAPCSVKTLAAVAQGYADTLIARAADVTLKERRRLVLVVRESPLSLVHIENMRRVTLAGGSILPPVLSFYTRPGSLADVVDQVAGRVLDALGLEHDLVARWR